MLKHLHYIGKVDELELLKHMNSAMNNSYELLTNKKTIEELLVVKGISNLVFAHDIESTIPLKEDVENIIYYFTQEQDFEKCAELSKLIN